MGVETEDKLEWVAQYEVAGMDIFSSVILFLA
jgi:hypothetical protein